MSLDLDDLYALRLYYTDTIHDEFQIIKKLKIELFNSGVRNQDQINNTLVEFYKKFNMEWLTKEMIQTIQLPQMYSFLDILNIANNPGTSQVDPETTSSNTQNNSNQESNLSGTNLTDSDLEDEINTDSDSDSDLDSMPELIDDDDPNYHLNQLFSIPTPFNNNLEINRLNNISINMNAFNIFLSQVLNSHINPPNMEDVKKYNGIKEQDLNNLKEYNIKEDSQDSCCICMMNFDKETKMVELPCGHKFHSFCIKKWFTESSNTCPICKKEYGEAQYLYNGEKRNS